jgi:hypothetical protein
MARLRPVPAARHTSPSTFVHSDLERCTSSASTQHAGLWNPPTAAPTGSCHGERRLFIFSCAGGLSLCQRTGSSRPTPSMGPTTGATSTHQSQHPRPQHHQPRRHSSSQKLHAPAVAFISLLVSTSEQASRRGGDVGTSHNSNRLLPPVPKSRRYLYPTDY